MVGGSTFGFIEKMDEEIASLPKYSKCYFKPTKIEGVAPVAEFDAMPWLISDEFSAFGIERLQWLRDRGCVFRKVVGSDWVIDEVPKEARDPNKVTSLDDESGCDATVGDGKSSDQKTNEKVSADGSKKKKSAKKDAKSKDEQDGDELEKVVRPRVCLEFANSNGPAWCWEYCEDALCLREVEDYMIERIANDEEWADWISDPARESLRLRLLEVADGEAGQSGMDQVAMYGTETPPKRPDDDDFPSPPPSPALSCAAPQDIDYHEIGNAHFVEEYPIQTANKLFKTKPRKIHELGKGKNFYIVGRNVPTHVYSWLTDTIGWKNVQCWWKMPTWPPGCEEMPTDVDVVLCG